MASGDDEMIDGVMIDDYRLNGVGGKH